MFHYANIYLSVTGRRYTEGWIGIMLCEFPPRHLFPPLPLISSTDPSTSYYFLHPLLFPTFPLGHYFIFLQSAWCVCVCAWF